MSEIDSIVSIINKIKDLLSNDLLEESLELVKRLTKTDSQINFLILQSARYKELKKAIMLNVVDWSSAQIEKAKIRKVMIEFIDEISTESKKNKLYTRGVSCQVWEADKFFLPKMVANLLDPIDEKILQFLKEFNEWYFSSTNILRRGRNQTAYELFANLSTEDMTNRLEKLYFRGKLVRILPDEGIYVYRIK